ILTFVLAMVVKPEVQAKVQAEEDSVGRPDLHSSISDKLSLPYGRSLITETSRWIPAVPLGLPDCLCQGDVYKGAYMQKGSIVMSSVWYTDSSSVRYIGW
ncbi:hypothetical protein WOLCODRAFT_76894, partial [Wolfiporia cocos MD-104 SS10]